MTASLESNGDALIGRIDDMSEYLRLQFIRDNGAAVGDTAIRHYGAAVNYLEREAARTGYEVEEGTFFTSPAHPAVEHELRYQ